MLPSYIEQLVYVACAHVVYGYTLHSTHRCARRACTTPWPPDCTTHFNCTCSTVILSVIDS